MAFHLETKSNRWRRFGALVIPLLLAPLLCVACVTSEDGRAKETIATPAAKQPTEECTWYHSGALKQRWFVRELPDGTFSKDGLYESWHEDGTSWERGYYVNDKKDGIWRVDQVAGDYSIHHWSKGQREGLWETWRSSGRRKAVEAYLGGKRHGIFAEWFESGSLYVSGSYDNDEKEGPWVEFHENGKLKKLELFRRGERIEAAQ